MNFTHLSEQEVQTLRGELKEAKAALECVRTALSSGGTLVDASLESAEEAFVALAADGAAADVLGGDASVEMLSTRVGVFAICFGN